MLTNAAENKALCVKLSEQTFCLGKKYLIVSQNGKKHKHVLNIIPCKECSGPLIKASVIFAWKLYDYENNGFLKEEPEFLEIINDFKERGVLNLPSYERKCVDDVISNISVFLQGVGNLSLEELQVIVDLTDHAHSWEIHELEKLLKFREWLLN